MWNSDVSFPKGKYGDNYHIYGYNYHEPSDMVVIFTNFAIQRGCKLSCLISENVDSLRYCLIFSKPLWPTKTHKIILNPSKSYPWCSR